MGSGGFAGSAAAGTSVFELINVISQGFVFDDNDKLTVDISLAVRPSLSLDNGKEDGKGSSNNVEEAVCTQHATPLCRQCDVLAEPNPTHACHAMPGRPEGKQSTVIARRTSVARVREQCDRRQGGSRARGSRQTKLRVPGLGRVCKG